MAYKTEDKIYLGADNRLSEQDGTPIENENKKIVVINKHLAIAFAGNSGTQYFFERFIKESKGLKKLKIKRFKIEDIMFYIETMFLSFKIDIARDYARNILNSSSYFIIVGKNKEKQNSIVAVSYVNGQLKNTTTEMIIFPPLGLDMQTCSNIFIKNLHCNAESCIQKSVKEISEKCKTVSPSGDTWIYNMNTGKSTLEHFL